MMKRSSNPTLAVLLTGWLCVCLPVAALAADEEQTAPAKDPVESAFALPPGESSAPPALPTFEAREEDREKKPLGPPRDPVETAFALPRGVHLTAAQTERFKKLRQRYEPQLRRALDKVEATTDESEKLLAAKAVLRLREKIHQQILSLLASSNGQGKAGANKGAGNNNRKKNAGPNRKRSHRKSSPAKKPTLGVRVPVKATGGQANRNKQAPQKGGDKPPANSKKKS